MYILYSIVRMNSIIKANETLQTRELKFTEDIEKKIINSLYKFPEVVVSLLISHEPAHLTKYIFNLTQDFSKFYESVHINHETNAVLKASRIRLLSCVKTVLENALGILGIETVDKI